MVDWRVPEGSLNEMTVEGMRALIRSGHASCGELLSDHLARIHLREGLVQAWSALDEEQAVRLARRYDGGAARRRHPDLPLYGIPVGIKDVIDTRGLETAYGSPLYSGNIPRADAYCVAKLKQAGALVVGKNMTAEFAYSNPTKTRNPHDVRYTAGGSSSGSAASVADFMVPVSISTQTGGSTIRPASYCGVVGFKPSYGSINRAGLKPLAESFDTIGMMARSVADIRTVFTILSGMTPRPAPISITEARVAFFRTPFWGDVHEAYRGRIEHVVDSLASTGCEVCDIDIDGAMLDQYDDHRLMLEVEASRSLMSEFENNQNLLSDSLRAHLAGGRLEDGPAYFEAKRRNRAAAAQFASLMAEYDVIVTPSCDGRIPEFEQGMGSSLYNRNWSAIGAPVFSLPIGKDMDGLPMGIQIVGAFSKDTELIEFSRFLEHLLSEDV